MYLRNLGEVTLSAPHPSQTHLTCSPEKVDKSYVEAPALPSDTPAPPKSEKEGMEDFLDDLLG